MKATELMIGDWVIDTYTNKPMRMSGVNSLMGEGLEPIPLTPEILEKNGFVLTMVGDNGVSTPQSHRNRYEKWECKTKWQDFDLIHDRHRDTYTLNLKYGHHIPDLKYVHQLQHALRLCGIEKEIEL